MTLNTPASQHDPPLPKPPICSFLNLCYTEAFQKTISDGKLPLSDENYKDPDVLSIAEHLLDLLQDEDKQKVVQSLSDFDQQVFKNFMIGLSKLVSSRQRTSGATKFIQDITNFTQFLVNWLNYEKGYHFDVKITSRRKSLEGDLEKILDYAIQAVREIPPNLGSKPLPPMKENRDRYGIRFILTQDNTNELFELVRIFLEILSDPFDLMRKDFEKWTMEVENLRFGGEDVPKDVILKILSHHFSYGFVKDLITDRDPVEDYRSYHATITVDSHSPSMGGFMFELQVRTYSMHENNEYGPPNHRNYATVRRPEASGVFCVSNYTGGINLYAGPDKPDLDLDGVSVHAPILERHASAHAVPHFKT